MPHARVNPVQIRLNPNTKQWEVWEFGRYHSTAADYVDAIRQRDTLRRALPRLDGPARTDERKWRKAQERGLA